MKKLFKDFCEVISWTYGVDFQFEQTGLRIKIKIIDFYPPWKVWQEFNTFDPSQTLLSLPKPRSQEKLGEEISLLPRFQNSSDLKFRVIYTADLLWDWPWRLVNAMTIFSSLLHLYFWWHFLEVKSLAQPEHFLQHYSVAHSQSYAAVGWGSVASESLLFDIQIPFTWVYPS